jgi:hypothetical protein
MGYTLDDIDIATKQCRHSWTHLIEQPRALSAFSQSPIVFLRSMMHER